MEKLLKELREKISKTFFTYETEFGKSCVDKTMKLIDDYIEQIALCNVVDSLTIQDLPNCTRVEVIDEKGRSYVNWKPTNKVRISMQDEGRTAKIFID